MKLKRFVYAMLALCVLLSSYMGAGIPKAAAAGAADTVTIEAGYFGLPKATKAVYTVSDMIQLGLDSCLYTVNTRGNFLAYADTQGVYLEDLLNEAGINTLSVNYLNFMATDGHNASKNYYYDTLFGIQYAFPDLSKYYSTSNGVTDADAAWETAEVVRPMLAIWDNFGRVDDFSEYYPYELTDSHRFRLMIGQQYPGHMIASDSIYHINKIIVTYVGFPSINAESQIKISVGDDMVLDISVSSADKDVSAMIADGLTFSSSNSSVVKVDSNGKLTPVSEGTAQITITYKANDIDGTDITKTINVVVGGEGSGEGGSGGEGGGLGDSDGTGDGGEDPQPEPSGSGSQGSIPQPETTPTPTPETTVQPQETPTPTPQPDPTPTPEATAQPQETPAPTPDPDPTPTATPTPEVTPQPQETPTPTPDPDPTPTPTANIPVEDQDSEDVYISTDPVDTSKPTLTVRKIKRPSEQNQPQQAPVAPKDEQSGAQAGGSDAIGLDLKNPMLMIAAAAAIVLFLLGGAAMFVKYKKEF